jgi:hypothetical protein
VSAAVTVDVDNHLTGLVRFQPKSDTHADTMNHVDDPTNGTALMQGVSVTPVVPTSDRTEEKLYAVKACHNARQKVYMHISLTFDVICL